MARERRKFTRVHQPFEVKYRYAGQFAESWSTATTLNISAGGLRFISPDRLEVKETLEVQIQLPSVREALRLKARVAWSQAQASGVAENGVEFLEVTPEQQVKIDELVRFLR